MGTDGFEFVEYTAPDTEALGRLFEQHGLRAVARHRSKDVTLYRQGDVNFIVNAEPDSFAQAFARVHGPSACAMAFRVNDAAARLQARARAGRRSRIDSQVGPMELNIPAIDGIGGSLIYLVDRYGPSGIDLRRRFRRRSTASISHPTGVGLTYIDHLTHNVHRGRMDALGATSTSGSSISARSAISTSRAS